ncbi:MFS transporter [Rathayibacter sp. VKM Ac-2857]|uniref:MFS transporter n=1 Tax=Rathayibacter sp. VKM Ac-2857 TaxID=2739020 RepID=UPI00156778D9|nr:MFS transporter [Rathayibacter sp. VKM Ac-2857]
MTASASAVDDLRTVRASFWRKAGYATGDFAYNFSWYIVSALLLVFYTDVFLIPAAVVSVFVLLIRLTDAVVDPIVGSMADRTRSRWGRYRPWILFAPIVMALAMTLTFWAHPDWSEPAKILYAVITFAIAAIASTAVNMPYGALGAVVSQNTDDRLRFASYRMVAASLGSTIIGFIIFPMLSFFSGPSGDSARGYAITVPIIGGVTVVLFLISFFSTKEVVQPVETAQPKMRQLWKSVGGNRPLQLVVIGFFLLGFIGYGRIAIMAYYFQYNIGDVSVFGTFNLVATGASVIGAIIAPLLLKLFPSGNKSRVLVLSCIIQAVFFSAMYVVASDLTLFFVFGGLAGIGQGVFSAMIFGMVPDTVEYGEVKSGVRSEGFNYAFTSLALKWGGAAGPAVLGILLASTGYRPNAEQSPEVLNAITLMLTLVPGILTLLIAVPFLFYKLDRTMFNDLVDELQRRKELATGVEDPDTRAPAPTLT